nr:ABC transporter ATP-binding protein [Staphylococcus condimenti]
MALEIHNLKKSFGNQSVIRDVNLEVGSGEFISLLGASGSGKTTLLRLIAGLEQPDSGTIENHEQLYYSNEGPTQMLAPSKRNIGMVFQDFALWPHMSVFENIAYPLRVKKDTKNLKQRVREVLQEVRLEGYEKRKIHELSGGQQQRVSLARAIISRCDLVLMDEPLSALDAGLREDMRLLIQRLVKQYGMTAIFVTHDQYEAMTMSDRIAVMQEGRIEQCDTPENLYAKPQSEAVARFIGKGSFVKGILKENRFIIQKENALDDAEEGTPERLSAVSAVDLAGDSKKDRDTKDNPSDFKTTSDIALKEKTKDNEAANTLFLDVEGDIDDGYYGLLLRPENVYTSHKGQHAVVSTVSFTGERYEYTAYINDMIVMFYDRKFYAEGDQVNLEFEVNQEYLIKMEDI